MKTAQVNVPNSLVQRAVAIANPPPAATMALKTVKTSPIKTLVSVKGRIISEEMAKTVQVRGQEVLVKAINVKDETDSIKVSLWRDLAESSFVGKYVEMTNLIVTAFNDEVSVSSTSRTDLKECEQPISEIKGSVVGFVMKEIALSILVCVEEEYRKVEAPLQMVASALFCEEDKIESVLESSLPMKCAFQLKDDTVQQILVMEKEETSD